MSKKARFWNFRKIGLMVIEDKDGLWAVGEKGNRPLTAEELDYFTLYRGQVEQEQDRLNTKADKGE